MKKTYRSKCGLYFFEFNFLDKGSHFDIVCTRHPGFNGRSSDSEKTHLYPSGRICFVSGHEPRNLKRAEKLAAQWAEYFLEYRRTGIAQD